MKDFYIYIIQVNIGLSVFYLLYCLLFSRDTFLEIRRLFLITVIGVAFLYPMISLASWLEPEESLQAVMVNYTEMLTVVVTAVVPAQENSELTWPYIILALWSLGGLILLLRMSVQFFTISRMVWRGERIKKQGQTVIALSGAEAPFSFLGWIFINPACHEEKEMEEIIAHEKTHVRQWHSLDILLGELLSLFLWFNPVVWLLRKEIRQNLEFLADHHVVSAGYNRKNYQYHLLRLSHQSTAVQIVNNFNVSSLKKRIIMMNKKPTSRVGLMKYALFIPVTGMLILSANAGMMTDIAESTIRGWDLVSHEKPQESLKNTKTISGKVTDEAGEPLQGVSVVLQSRSVGTLTSDKGEFELTVSEPGVLLFSYVGRKSKSEPYRMDAGKLNVVLEKNQIQLDQLQVVGYRAKDKETPAGEVFVVVEEMPEFSEGDLLRYLAKNVKYPVIAMENGIEGKVLVSFVVNTQGKVTDVKVTKGIDSSLDKEAVRVISEMPAWKPGKQRGKAVNVQYTMPIEFNLHKSEQIKFTLGEEKPTENQIKENQSGETRVTIKNVRSDKDKRLLFVVDGKKQPQDFNIGAISPDKIESVLLLKDKSAIQKYGDEGKHGVLLITLKK